MRAAPLTLVALISLTSACAQIASHHVAEGICAIDLPASWRREEVRGIDSRLVRYRGEAFLCEIEFGSDTARQGVRQIITDDGDHNVAYVGLRYDTLLFMPTESGYVTIRVFHRKLSDRTVALRILRSVTVEGVPNQALQHNAGSRPSSHDDSAQGTPPLLGPRG